ncbi:MAG: winged helix-turn-helix domain-containing protein [Candidatus Paceibacterota bacterium]
MTTSSYNTTSNKTTSGADKEAETVLKILNNKNRFAIMQLLLNADEDLCVYEISQAVGISQSAASHQLANLEAHGVVRGVRDGRTKCYVPTDAELTDKIARVINSLES